MTLTFIGHGYVGLVTACVFADLGNKVFVIGRDKEKIKKLNQGFPLIFEPGVEEILKRNLEQKRLFFTTEYKTSVSYSDVVFIAVGTPPKKNGETDLSSVFQVAKNIAKNLRKDKYTLVVCKSTVPVGTNREIKKIIEKYKPKEAKFEVASCPEFLKEGSALADTINPDRVVIGADSKKAIDILLDLHQPLGGKRVIVSIESAELIKYLANAFLATKVSFANLCSFLCEKANADVEEVLEGVGLDQRIGRVFLYPGVGYGGSCLPKDIKSLIHTGKKLGVDVSLFEAVEKINFEAKKNILKKILQIKPEKKIAIWGLSFKPNTDDIRDAPSLFILQELIKRKYEVIVYDPKAMANIKKIFQKKLVYAKNQYEAVKNASLLVILTEWNEFKQADLEMVKKLMKKPVIIDGRNIYSPQKMKAAGFVYFGVGRKI